MPLWEHILVSLRRVFGAFLAAAVLGVLFGVLLGWFKTFRKIFYPLYNLLRPIPPIAWIPIIVLLFGIGELPKMIIVFIGAFTPIVFNTYSAGAHGGPPWCSTPGIVLGANERQLLFQGGAAGLHPLDHRRTEDRDEHRVDVRGSPPR